MTSFPKHSFEAEESSEVASIVVNFKLRDRQLIQERGELT